MGGKPEFIDNIDGNTMSAALRKLLVGKSAPKFDEARIVTAYFNPEGFSRIATAIKDIPSIKLMIGSDPIPSARRWQRKDNESEENYINRRLNEKLLQQEEALRAERDHIPFTKQDSFAVRQLVNSLRAGNMQVRRYEKTFLHAKAYIFTPPRLNNQSVALIAGSSNLTAAGFNSNLELNLGRYDLKTVVQAQNWFDELWDEAKPFDLAAFFEEMLEERTPYEIFVRVLWELYGNELLDEIQTDSNLPLTTFQKHGVERAKRLIRETGGAIVADEVGLGKTYIAGDILNIYRERRQRALLVCPAALRDTTWKRFQHKYQLYLEVISFEQLAQDRQLVHEIRRPNSKGEHIQGDIDQYQLIIIDEAHNYRNPDSPMRADALRALLYGRRKDVLMLTATPVNNSLWDLYYLTMFFLKYDYALAKKGIRSIKERFNQATRYDPTDLSPDILYPIVDATTVKRTRQFIKTHYPNDQIEIDGKLRPIKFPKPVAISVRYELDSLLPDLFDLIETYFDPDNSESIKFARYKTNTYRKNADDDDIRIANAVTGLLLSGLLKRFESSTGAFRTSIMRMTEQHEFFLKTLENGKIANTEFLNESTGTDDEGFDDLLKRNSQLEDATDYNAKKLKLDVTEDLCKLNKILNKLRKITVSKDPKLNALVAELEAIVVEAKMEAGDHANKQVEVNKRKVLIFTFYTDTAEWIKEHLDNELVNNQNLSVYRDKFEIVAGSGDGDVSKSSIAAGFAPDTAGRPSEQREIDLLVSTDVLAEGLNLQQARHIINYDMPWNPMRLVQRHGRIDRIGSKHNKVFLRTIFPTDRLDDLLGLNERIATKIAMAAASVGIVSPIEEVKSRNRNFTETREEIQKLLDEDASLYERGGTEASMQSGEEYRQLLRKEISTHSNRKQIEELPWKVGSGMCKGKEQGIFFCARVKNRTYLRFVHADKKWKPKFPDQDTSTDLPLSPIVEGELGRCLRVIECGKKEKKVLNKKINNAAYDFWPIARDSIFDEWNYETIPKNIQPKVRKLNRDVAKFLRNNPSDKEKAEIDKAIEILESPWGRRDEANLKIWFNSEKDTNKTKANYIIEEVLKSGIEPHSEPTRLPSITKEDVELIVWLAISSVKP